jgi:hypothetical protein
MQLYNPCKLDRLIKMVAIPKNCPYPKCHILDPMPKDLVLKECTTCWYRYLWDDKSKSGDY